MFPEGGLRKCEEVGRVDAHGVTTEALLCSMEAARQGSLVLGVLSVGS